MTSCQLGTPRMLLSQSTAFLWAGAMKSRTLCPRPLILPSRRGDCTERALPYAAPHAEHDAGVPLGNQRVVWTMAFRLLYQAGVHLIRPRQPRMFRHQGGIDAAQHNVGTGVPLPVVGHGLVDWPPGVREQAGDVDPVDLLRHPVDGLGSTDEGHFVSAGLAPGRRPSGVPVEGTWCSESGSTSRMFIQHSSAGGFARVYRLHLLLSISFVGYS